MLGLLAPTELTDADMALVRDAERERQDATTCAQNAASARGEAWNAYTKMMTLSEYLPSQQYTM